MTEFFLKVKRRSLPQVGNGTAGGQEHARGIICFSAWSILFIISLLRIGSKNFAHSLCMMFSLQRGLFYKKEECLISVPCFFPIFFAQRERWARPICFPFTESWKIVRWKTGSWNASAGNWAIYLAVMQVCASVSFVFRNMHTPRCFLKIFSCN